MAALLLGRRREDRLGQLLRSRCKPGGSGMPQTAAACAVLLPAGAGQVAAHHALDRHHLASCAPASSGPASSSALGGERRPHRRQVGARGGDWARRGKSSQKSVRPVSTRPLSGMPVGSTQSKALMRSVATMTRRSPRS